MILFNDSASIIESFYLYSGITENKFEADIIINPDSDIWMNKTIWVNSPNYDLSVLSELSKNNIIKSRLKIPNASFNYQYTPYRNDRIKRLRFEIIAETHYEISRQDISKLIIFESSPGKLATTLPVYDKSDLKIHRSEMSVYELYLHILENSLDGKSNTDTIQVGT